MMTREGGWKGEGCMEARDLGVKVACSKAAVGAHYQVLSGVIDKTLAGDVLLRSTQMTRLVG